MWDLEKQHGSVKENHLCRLWLAGLAQAAPLALSP